MIVKESAQTFAHQWITAWNSHDLRDAKVITSRRIFP